MTTNKPRTNHDLPRTTARRRQATLFTGALLVGAVLLCCSAALLGWAVGAWRLFS